MAQIGEFFTYGFGGMAVMFFGLASLIVNIIMSSFVIIRKEEKNNIKINLILSAILSFVITFLFTIKEYLTSSLPAPLSESIIFFIIALPWQFYFAVVPSLIILWINKKILKMEFDKKDLIKRRVLLVVIRIVLTITLPIILYISHAIIGTALFGITPD